MSTLQLDTRALSGALSGADLAQAVREAALLADVTISVWGADRTDRTATDELKASKGASGQVGRFVKNLLAGVDGRLKDTKAMFSAVRSRHYALTLPWVSDPHAERMRGPRLLPHLLFERYMNELSALRRAALVGLDGFIAEYPGLVTQARLNLGDLADEHYPTPEEVRANFRVSFDFEPIPAGSSFKGLPALAIERLDKNLQAKQQRMVASAQAAMWEAVRERLGPLMARLSDPEGRFRASTIEHVRELITLLPGWNVAGDHRALEVVEDIKRMLAGVTPDDLRSDARMRTTVVSEAQAVTDKLSQWGL